MDGVRDEGADGRDRGEVRGRSDASVGAGIQSDTNSRHT